MIEFIFWLIISVVLMALAEYWIHRLIMHRRFFKNKHLAWIFEEHHIEHHKKHRYDINVDLSILFHLILSSPLIVFLFFYTWIGLVAWLLTISYHSIFWTKLHRSSHDLEHNWTEKLPWYQGMRRHHLNHHINPSKNFAVVFPITDKIFRTKYVEDN